MCETQKEDFSPVLTKTGTASLPRLGNKLIVWQSTLSVRGWRAVQLEDGSFCFVLYPVKGNQVTAQECSLTNLSSESSEHGSSMEQRMKDG